MKLEHNKPIALWLLASALLVLLMIFIGGLTRLTHSGLSMVEWQLFNLFPPLTTEEWSVEFAKYQLSPEFKQVNNFITLENFKSIFWLEYIHRILGRICGIVIIIPMIYFYYHNYFQKKSIWPLSLGILVVMQGVIGWYMVKSGLVNTPNVSHYRLALHLSCATFLYCIILWYFLKYLQVTKCAITKKLEILILSLLTLSFLQIICGAFVAGLKAGMIYNQFPLMGETFIPMEIYNIKGNIFSDMVFVQFTHRMLAYIIVTLSLVASLLFYKEKLPLYAFLIAIIPIMQSILGIVTLIYIVPMEYALMHQMFSMALISVYLLCRYKFRS